MKKFASIAVIALLVLAGCSSKADDSSDAKSTPTPTASVPSTQATPEATVIAFYEAIADGDIEAACALISPDVDWPEATNEAFPTCQAALFTNYSTRGTARFNEVEVDDAKVTINGNTALVPEAAVTFAGKPSTDSDNPLILIDGRWYLVPPS